MTAGFNYATVQSVASRLLARFGQAGVVRRTVGGEPWTPGPQVGATTTDYPCSLVVEDYTARELKDAPIQQGDRKALIAAIGLPIAPEMGDWALVGGVVYDVLYAKPLDPAGTALLYEAQIGKASRKQAVLRRRMVAGAVLGGFQDVGTLGGFFRQTGESEVSVSGFVYTAKIGALTVRDTAAARAIGPSYRIVLDGDEYEVRAATRPDAREGTIHIALASAPNRAAYADAMNQRGDTITVQRPVSGGAPIEAFVRARVMGYSAEELASGVHQAGRKIVALAEDLENDGWPVPPRANDIAFVNGRKLTIQHVDDNTHRFAGVLNAYEMHATG